MVVLYRATLTSTTHLGLVESFPDAVIFWKSLPVKEHQRVPNLEPAILNRHRQPVIGARAAKRQQIATRLQHPQRLSPERDTRHAVIPRLAHEREAVRWIGHNRVD